MDIDQKIIERLEGLIQKGEEVIKTKYESATVGNPYIKYLFVNSQISTQWGISCLNLLKRVFGKESDHYTKFDSLFPKLNYYTSANQALGVLKAAKDDYENAYLFEIRFLIQAEVFDDFLEQAKYLFDTGYYQPAAVIAGSVLEDGLRKLCNRNSITLPSKPKLDTMNADLVKKEIYNSLVQKQITALADLRNKAAHGKWTEFTDNDVEQMITQVRTFIETHFS